MNGASLWSLLSVEPEQVKADEDPKILWEQYFRRQRLLKQVVEGEMHPDDLLDCLIEDHLSPDEYLKYLDDALRDIV